MAEEADVGMEAYLDAISPKKAFSFAIKGGLNVDCALEKCVIAGGEDC